jgi:hypothetical protein
MTIEPLTALEPQISPVSLYDQDFLLWVQTTVGQLRKQEYAQVDWGNLIDEIEAMGKRERRSLKSNLVILLLHLLKWQYQPEQRSGSGQGSIVEHRQRIRDELADSPSLQSYLVEIWTIAYADSRQRATAETGLAIEVFPVDCPYAIADILNEDFLPD